MVLLMPGDCFQQRLFAIFSLFLILMASTAHAQCSKIEPNPSELTFDFNSASNSEIKMISVYVERSADSACAIEIKQKTGNQGYFLINPPSIDHDSFSYSIYPVAVNLTIPAYMEKGANASIVISDKYTGEQLALIPVKINVNVGHLSTLNITIPGCENSSTPGCEKPVVKMPATQPSIIEQNFGNISLIVLTIVVFGLIVGIFFLLIRGK